MPSFDPQDLSTYKYQLVKVFKPNGTTFIDTWRDAPLLQGFKETLSSAPTPLRVKLPRQFDFFDEGGVQSYITLGSIAQGNVVQYWLYGPGLPSTGFLRYQGQIDAYAPEIAESGEECVTVTITPFGSVVGDQAISDTINFGTVGNSATYVDARDMFKWWFDHTDPATGNPWPQPLTWDPTNPTATHLKSQYSFVNQRLIDIFDICTQLAPTGWFWRINTDKTVTFNVTPTTAQHKFVIGQHCTSPQYKKDWTQLRNVVLFVGSSDAGITKVAKGTDITTFGKRVLRQADSRVTDATTASTLASAYLAKYDRMTYRAKIRVLDYRGDIQSGIGYDIETIKVGDSCSVSNPTSLVGDSTNTEWDQATWDSSNWDFNPNSVLNQVVQIVSISYGFDYVDLELGDLQPNQDRKIIEIQNQLDNFTLG